MFNLKVLLLNIFFVCLFGGTEAKAERIYEFSDVHCSVSDGHYHDFYNWCVDNNGLPLNGIMRGFDGKKKSYKKGAPYGIQRGEYNKYLTSFCKGQKTISLMSGKLEFDNGIDDISLEPPLKHNLEKMQNPNMEYADTSDVSVHIKNILKDNEKSFTKEYYETDRKVGDSSLFDIVEKTTGYTFWDYVEDLPDDIVGKYEYFSLYKRGESKYDKYDNLGQFDYKEVCEEFNTNEQYHDTYNKSCLAKAVYNEQNLYMNCVSQMNKYDGWERIQYHQGCLEAIRLSKENCRTGTKKTSEIVCNKPIKFVVTNEYGKDVIIIPLNEKQPNMEGVPYSRVIKALYEKYGPATYSFSTSDNEAYYWVDNPWILRIKVIPDKQARTIGDDYNKIAVKALLTIYINKDAFADQIEFIELENQHIIEAIKETDKQLKKEHEDRINNFKL